MKKNILLALIFALTPILIFSLFAQETVAKGPIYLHQQQRGLHTSSEHLNQFAGTGSVILDFYADWCNPCKRMSPLIDAAAANLSQFTFVKINRDAFMDLAKAFNITSIPTLIFLQDGKEIGRYDGGPLTQNTLEQLILDKYQQ
jgi:thioredoxin 1